MSRRARRREGPGARRRQRVLVLDAESPKALAVVRALGGEMVVRTVSRRRPAIAAWSRHTVEHLEQPVEPGDRLVPWLRHVCRSRRIDAVVPVEEPSSWLLARDRALLEAEGVLVPVPPLEVLETAMDKAATIDAARAAGVPVPPTVVLERGADLRAAARAAARELGWPLVVKPRFSHWWTGERFVECGGVAYAASEADLERALDSQPDGAPPPLLQACVPGSGLGIFVALAPGGALVAEFAHQRLRDLRPTGSGSVLRRSVAVDPQLRELALELLRAIGWWGVAMVEFRGDLASGKVALMEINGRFWGSLQLAIDAGVDFPRLLLDAARGVVRPAPAYREDVVLRWWLGDLVRLGRVLQGPPRGFTGAFPSRREGLAQFLGRQPAGTRNEVLRRDDPLPAVAEVLSAAASTLQLLGSRRRRAAAGTAAQHRSAEPSSLGAPGSKGLAERIANDEAAAMRPLDGVSRAGR